MNYKVPTTFTTADGMTTSSPTKIKLLHHSPVHQRKRNSRSSPDRNKSISFLGSMTKLTGSTTNLTQPAACTFCLPPPVGSETDYRGSTANLDKFAGKLKINISAPVENPDLGGGALVSKYVEGYEQLSQLSSSKSNDHKASESKKQDDSDNTLIERLDTHLSLECSSSGSKYNLDAIFTDV